MNSKTTAVLRFKIGENGWSSPPTAIWREILENFIFELADSFAVSGIVSPEELGRNTIFDFVDVRQVPFLRLRDFPARGPLPHSMLGMFELTETAKSVFRFAPFGRISPDPENHGIYDEIHFFAGPQCLAITRETDLFLPELNTEFFELLCAAHPQIRSSLWDLEDLTKPYRLA